MEVNGKIAKVLQCRQGTNSKGESWKMQDYLLAIDQESGSGYQRYMTFTIFDGKKGRINTLDLKERDHITAFINIDAKEYNGKWYNSFECYNARKLQE